MMTHEYRRFATAAERSGLRTDEVAALFGAEPWEVQRWHNIAALPRHHRTVLELFEQELAAAAASTPQATREVLLEVSPTRPVSRYTKLLNAARPHHQRKRSALTASLDLPRLHIPPAS